MKIALFLLLSVFLADNMIYSYPMRSHPVAMEVSSDDTSNPSPLFEAVESNDIQRTIYLLNSKEIFNVNERNEYGQTPLIIAAKFGYFDIVKALLQLSPRGFIAWLNDVRIKKNLVDHSGRTALYYARENEHEAVAELLERNGARLIGPNIPDSHSHNGDEVSSGSQ